MMEEATSGQTKLKDRKKSKRWIAWSRIRRRLMVRYLWVVRAGIVLVIIGVGVGLFLFLNLLLRWVGLDRYVAVGRAFVFPSEARVELLDGRTNILVLGKAGEGEVAGSLTDTMIMVSVSHNKEGKIKMISLSRDIWISDLRAKLNSAYYWGNEKKQGGGLVLAKASAEEILGVPIHYGVVIDYDGFNELIDAMGGIEIAVERGFTDEWFPIVGKEADECDGDREYKCRYETIVFEEGQQQMDGDKALKYVRSRRSTNLDEGTDTARSARQRQVLAAVQRKLVSREIVRFPRKLKELYELGLAMIETDMSEIEMATLGRRMYDAKDKIEAYEFVDEFLVNPPMMAKYDYLYVFVPDGSVGKDEDWSAVHQWVDEIME